MSWNNWTWTCESDDWLHYEKCSAPIYYCWDWYLDRPNTFWADEECDFWDPSNFPSWCWKPWTEQACKIKDYSEMIKDTWIKFEPNNIQVIWHWMNVWDKMWQPKIINNSSSDLFIPKKLCVKKIKLIWPDNSLNKIPWSWNECSSWNIWLLKRGSSFSFPRPDYKWVILNKPWGTYSTYVLNTSIEWHHNNHLSTPWLSRYQSTINHWSVDHRVRVAKPSVLTVWWWASKLSNTNSNFSDLNIISDNYWYILQPPLNKNFILTSLWINPLSSFSKKVDNNKASYSWFVDEGNRDINNFWWDLVSMLASLDLNIGDASELETNFETFRWHSNVFEYKWNVTINNPITITWNKTFIIEDWDFNINWNINSSDSILFVVRNWDVVINNNVDKIDAVIINIWWEIKWSSWYTTNRLVVNWALYWDVSDLLWSRTYIADRWAYIDVWTNINFTSKIFSSPPPLLSRFIWEYMEVEKIAR